MSLLLGVVLLGAGGAFAAVLTFVARWAAALPFGVRSFREAYKAPIGDGAPTTSLALARAAGGVAGWYLASSLLVACAVFMGGESRVDEQNLRVSVGENGPAARVGIANGDRVLAVDGVEVHDWDALKKAVASHADETVRVEVERGGQRLVFEPKPEGSPPKIMVGPETQHAEVGLGSAIATGLVSPAKVNIAMARGLSRAISGAETPEVTGPVGIARATGSAQRQGLGVAVHFVGLLIAYVLPYMAAISIALAFVARRRPAR
jgi:membrane-associated protease RseP (regulator of RpoE activity)